MSPKGPIKVENQLDSSPRLIFGDKSPIELFNQLLAFQKLPMLQRLLEATLPILVYF